MNAEKGGDSGSSHGDAPERSRPPLVAPRPVVPYPRRRSFESDTRDDVEGAVGSRWGEHERVNARSSAPRRASSPTPPLAFAPRAHSSGNPHLDQFNHHNNPHSHHHPRHHHHHHSFPHPPLPPTHHHHHHHHHSSPSHHHRPSTLSMGGDGDPSLSPPPGLPLDARSHTATPSPGPPQIIDTGHAPHIPNGHSAGGHGAMESASHLHPHAHHHHHSSSIGPQPPTHPHIFTHPHSYHPLPPNTHTDGGMSCRPSTPDLPALEAPRNTSVLGIAESMRFRTRADSRGPTVAGEGMPRNDSLASLIELRDHECDQCVSRTKDAQTPSPQVTLNSMPDNLRRIMRHTSADFGGAFVPERQEEGTSFLERSLWMLNNARTTCLLVLLGLVTSVVEHTMTVAINSLINLQAALATLAGDGYYPTFVVTCGFTVGITVLAVYVCSLLDPKADSAGSGLPLLKYILSGEVMEEAEEHLKPNILVAKCLGLVLAAGANLSVGREGPNVHMASIVSWLLMKHIPWFKVGIFKFPPLRRQVLDAACAVGVSSTFAAPIGGVLFSIEATTNYYEISNYWKCFLASVAGYSATRLIAALAGVSLSPLGRVSGEIRSPASHLPLYLLIGTCLGFVGPIYVKTKVYVSAHLSTYNNHVQWRYVVAAVVAFMSVLLFYFPGKLTRMPLIASTAALLSSEEGVLPKDDKGQALLLFIYAIVRFTTSAMDTSLLIPSGDFMCLFSLGAAMGRLFALGVRVAAPDWKIDVATFAMCGAAALSGGATQTISSAVIAIELTGHYGNQLPVFAATLAAYVISRGLSQSIYDAMTRGRYMRYLPSIRTDMYYKLTAEDVMCRDIVSIPIVMQYRMLIETMRAKPFRAYPVVTPDQEFLGNVKRRTLLRHLGRVFRARGLMPELEQLMPKDIQLVKKAESARHREHSAQKKKEDLAKRRRNSFSPRFAFRIQSRETEADVSGGVLSGVISDGKEGKGSGASGVDAGSGGGAGGGGHDGDGLAGAHKLASTDEGRPAITSATTTHPPTATATTIDQPSTPVGRDASHDGSVSSSHSRKGLLHHFYDHHHHHDTHAGNHTQQQQQHHHQQQQRQHHRGSDSEGTSSSASLARALFHVPAPAFTRNHSFGGGKSKPHSVHKDLSSLDVILRSPGETARQLKKLLDSELDLRVAQDVSVDPSAFRVSELCPLNDVYALFDLTRCNRVYVVSYGVLVGVISRRILIQNIKLLQESWGPAAAAATIERQPSGLLNIPPAVSNAATLLGGAGSMGLRATNTPSTHTHTHAHPTHVHTHHMPDIEQQVELPTVVPRASALTRSFTDPFALHRMGSGGGESSRGGGGDSDGGGSGGGGGGGGGDVNPSVTVILPPPAASPPARRRTQLTTHRSDDTPTYPGASHQAPIDEQLDVSTVIAQPVPVRPRGSPRM